MTTEHHNIAAVRKEKAARPHSLHILLLGVLSDRGALAVGFELVLNNLSICIVFDAERVVQHPSDVILSKPRQQKKKILLLFDYACTILIYIPFYYIIESSFI